MHAQGTQGQPKGIQVVRKSTQGCPKANPGNLGENSGSADLQIEIATRPVHNRTRQFTTGRDSLQPDQFTTTAGRVSLQPAIPKSYAFQ